MTVVSLAGRQQRQKDILSKPCCCNNTAGAWMFATPTQFLPVSNVAASQSGNRVEGYGSSREIGMTLQSSVGIAVVNQSELCALQRPEQFTARRICTMQAENGQNRSINRQRETQRGPHSHTAALPVFGKEQRLRSVETVHTCRQRDIGRKGGRFQLRKHVAVRQHDLESQ